MTRILFDAALVADAYDVNRNGLVSDELRVELPSVDSDGDGTVSIRELAQSLEKDTVEVSGGAIRAAQARTYPSIDDIPLLSRIAETVKEGKRVGNRYEPHDRNVEKAPDGSTREVINYEVANATLKRKLKSIVDAAASGEDPLFSTLRDIAESGLERWWQSDDRRYQDMYRALEAIEKTIGGVPYQPETSVRLANEAVLKAQANLHAAQKELGTPQAQKQLLSDAENLLQTEKSKKGLMKWFVMRKVTKLEAAVSDLKAFEPEVLHRQLAETARKSYELSLWGSDATTLGQARHLDAASLDLRGKAGKIDVEAERVLKALTHLQEELKA